MAAGKLLCDLADDLLCSICLDLFKAAVMLKCGHSFCKSCIDKTWDSQKNPTCPECREVFSSRKYTVNWQLCKAVESRQRSRQYEKKEIPNQEQKGHNLLGPEQGCSEHKEEFKGFCQHDGCPVCVICMMSSKHKGHTFIPILEATSMFQDKLKSTVSSLEGKVKYLKKCQSKQEQNISGIKNEAQNLEQHITSQFAKLRHFLQDKEQELVQQLKDEAAGILEKMTENLEKIEEMNKAVQKDKASIESTLQQEDSVLLLKGITDEIKSVMKRLEEEEKEDIQKKKRKGVFNGELISGSLSLGVYRGPLQYSIWKEMLSAIHPGLSHLTLDPITANPRLTLSDDFTSLTHGNAKWRPENPKRYDSYLSALGWQGFTSGRHYWEVEVGCNTEWELGVTRQSSNRKGLVAMKPKDGYWILSLWNEMNWSLHSSDQLLRLNVKPRKIGVYLDYEGGQVSFYSADNMSHICTFTDTFTETLYPYFGIGCYSKPLNLFHLKL